MKEAVKRSAGSSGIMTINKGIAADVEKLVQKYQDELTQVEAQLADSDIYQAEHKAKLTELLKRQAKLTQDLEANEMQWLDLEEQIEEIMSQTL